MITAYVKIPQSEIPIGIKAQDLSFLQVQELLNNAVLTTKLSTSFKGRDSQEIRDKVQFERRSVDVIHIQIQVILGIPDG